MKRAFLLLVIVGLLVMGYTMVEAHTMLDHAEPKVGSTVAAPAQVRVWFTEDLEGAFSRLQVFDATGKEVDKEDLKVNGAVMTVTLSKLPPGTYKVAWKAVSTDSHKTSGTFGFTVK